MKIKFQLPEDMRTRLRQYVLFPLLLFYSLCLVIAGFPDELSNQYLRPLQFTTRELFASSPFTIKAGIFVFTGLLGDEKHKDMRLKVIGEKADGTRVTLYNSYEGSHPPSIRLYESRLENVQKRQLYSYNFGIWGDDMSETVAYLRKAEELSAMSRFYCESPLVLERHLTRVYYTWVLTTQSYTTGKVTARSDVVHQYNCLTGHPETGPAPEIIDFVPEGPILGPPTGPEK